MKHDGLGKYVEVFFCETLTLKIPDLQAKPFNDNKTCF